MNKIYRLCSIFILVGSFILLSGCSSFFSDPLPFQQSTTPTPPSGTAAPVTADLVPEITDFPTEPGPNGEPPPVPDNNPALPYGYDNFTPNYARKLDGVFWWKNFPIQVAFVNDHITNSQSLRPIISEGIDGWKNSMDGKINYSWVADPTEAQITIQFLKLPAPPDDQEELGFTRNSYYQENMELVSVEIFFYVWDDMPEIYLTSGIRWVALHEMGHALGLDGHSDQINDIMYQSTDLTRPVSVQLTERDINTMKTAYAHLWLGGAPQSRSGGKLLSTSVIR